VTGKWRIPAVAVLLAAVVSAPAVAAPVIRAEVEPTAVAEDGTVRFRVIVEGAATNELQPPSLSALEDWKVINGPSIASQFRYVNGVSSTLRTFSWILAPVGPGERDIPELGLEIDGQRFVTEPITVIVRPSPSTSARGSPGRDETAIREPDGEVSTDDVFIRAEVEPQSPFVGEPAILSYKLYTRREVTSVPQLQEVPSYPNFWSQEIESPTRITPDLQTIDGREYKVYIIRRLALFPTASGETELPPVIFSVPVRTRDTSPFRRPFFFSSVEPIYRRTLPLTVNVRPLPVEGRPADFSGAVGRFRMETEADRTEAKAGEAIGLTLTVSGDGNLRSAVAPGPAENANFTVYPAQEKQIASADDSLAQVRAWEYIFIPHVPGRQPLPEVRFAYFDPTDESYHILSTPEHAVNVTGSPLATDELGGVERREIRRLGTDIHFLKTAGWTPPVLRPPLYRSAWFWVLLIAPPTLNAAALLARWQSRRARSRLALSRRRRARRTALKRLHRAETDSDLQDIRAFYRNVAQALTEFVADKFGRSPTGLTYDRIAGLLAARSVPDGVSRSYLKVLEECDCARFSPEAATTASRVDLLRRAHGAITELESHL
jgi:hypothetical protein